MRFKCKFALITGCIAAFLCLIAVGCSDEYDDSALTGRVDNLENRVASLEKLCEQMNSNIEAIQKLVDAAQNNISITSVTPLTEGGVNIGYTIKFTKGDPITIYHGQDGKDGQDGADGEDGADGQNGRDGITPIIGVKQDTDGIYYWTLNGEWLTDEGGAKVKAVGMDGKDGQDGQDGADGEDGQDGADGQNGQDGKDGQDGVSPQLKIEGGRWLLSMDNGASWQDLGQATGADGQDGQDGQDGINGEDGKDGMNGDSFFESVDYTTSVDYVLFTLTGGTVLKIPTWYAFDQLQARCDQFNEDILTLKSLVEALQSRDAVTRVETLMLEGKEAGYTLYFEQHAPVNIYHGKDGQNGQDGQDGQDGMDGQDGNSPLIGVRQDTDGKYYWTLNGEWLTGEAGEKIKAEGSDGAPGQDGQDGTDGQPGADGQDAITPQLKIEEDGYWYISYNSGSDWTRLGKATGENGQDGQDGADGRDGDSFFKEVTEDEDYVYLTLLSDESTIAVPKRKPLSVAFSETEDIRVLSGRTYPIQYTISGATEKTVIKALAQDGFRVVVKPTDHATGTIEVTAPATILTSEVLVFVTDGAERTIMRSINFVEGVINITNRSYTVGYTGGRVEVELSTNIDYTVEIPEADQSWVSLAQNVGRVVMRDETIVFDVQQNNSTQLRYTVIKLVDKLGVTSETIQITQRGGSSQDVEVSTPGTLEQLISSEDAKIIEELKLTGHLNTFDYEFLKTMPNLKSVDLSGLSDEVIPASAFSGSKVSTVLLPLNLKTISSRAFYKSAITSIYIPETVESIGEYAFAETQNLSGNVEIPGSVRGIGDYAFYQSSFDGVLTLHEGLQTIGQYAFSECGKVTGDLIIPNTVTEMGIYVFSESTFTGSLRIGNGLEVIPQYAFSDCSSFSGTLTIGENVIKIEDYAFSKCSKFTGNLIIPDKVEKINERAFFNCKGFTGYLSIGVGVTEIGSRAFCSANAQDNDALYFSKVYSKALTPPTLESSGSGSYYNYNNPFGNPFAVYPSDGSYPKYLGISVGTKQLYSRKSGWSKFEIIEEIEF